MGKDTAIAWTDHTFNPWWGCVKVAPECEHCYAEGFDKRTGGAHWGPTAPRRYFREKHWDEPRRWNDAAWRARRRSRVFCGSMCDVFERSPGNDVERAKIWTLIRETPALDWLLLTKRPENIPATLPALWGDGWPNVWLGASVGHPASMARAFWLAEVPAAVRFVSCEPLIAPVLFPTPVLLALDWMIIGGESGPRARPMDIEWARALHTQAKFSGIYYFAKQLGGARDKRDRLEDFPEDLCVREFPKVSP
jgi:protein gp37